MLSLACAHTFFEFVTVCVRVNGHEKNIEGNRQYTAVVDDDEEQ